MKNKSTKKISFEEAVTRAKDIHGTKYIYLSQSTVKEGKRNRVMFNLVCPIHGEFSQRRDSHYQGKGCPKCGNDEILQKEFITQADTIHKSKYTYDKTIYLDKKTKVIITCNTHGDFLQTAEKHLAGQGCPKCIATYKIPFTEFVQRANKAHDNKYDYSKAVFKNMSTKIEIICKEHGSFWQQPWSHINQKLGCPSCSNNNTSNAATEWLESFKNDNMIKEHTMNISGKRFKVDGYDPTTKTIYEYFGSFWHGHPSRVDFKEGVNSKNKIPFRELYEKTLERIDIFNQSEYNFIYIWGR